MKDDDTNFHGWENCEPGTISEFVELKESVRKRDYVSKISSGIIVVASIATLFAVIIMSSSGGAGSLNRSGDSGSAVAISCHEVSELLPAFAERKISDRSVVLRIRKHLLKCELCNAKYRQLQLGQLEAKNDPKFATISCSR